MSFGKKRIVGMRRLLLAVGLLLVTGVVAIAYQIVNVVDTTNFGSPNPSGLTAFPNSIFLTDSEVTESPFFDSNNLFELTPSGVLIAPYSAVNYSIETTGAAYNTYTGTLFITDDDESRVFEVDPSNPAVLLGSFSTSAFGSGDPEGITFDPLTGNLYIADGASDSIFEVTPDGSLIRSFTIPVNDPEGIYFDIGSLTFYVVSGRDREIFVIDVNGSLIETINILPKNTTPKGITFGPCSANPNDFCLFVADYGVDQVNDGRLIEISLDDQPGGNQAPVVDAGEDQVWPAGTTEVTLSGTVTDGDSSGVTTMWSKVSGPDPVTIATPTALTTTATLAGSGTYVFRLSADDGEALSSDIVSIAVLSDGGGGGGIVHAETQTGGSTDSNTVTTASLTAVVGDLYLAAVSTKPDSGVATVAGLGLTWTPLQGQCGGRSQTGVDVWMAQGVPSAPGGVTATLEETVNAAVLAVSRYSGVDGTAPVGAITAANTKGVLGACSGGRDNAAYTVNVSTTVADALVYAAVALRHRQHEPGAGVTELVETAEGSSGGNTAGIAVLETPAPGPGPVTVNGTFNNDLDWAVIAIELRPQE